MSEKVNHPAHYNRGIETIDYIESHGLDFNEGNVVKYVTRWRMKGGVEDLKKARFYLDRLIAMAESSPKDVSSEGELSKAIAAAVIATQTTARFGNKPTNVPSPYPLTKGPVSEKPFKPGVERTGEEQHF